MAGFAQPQEKEFSSLSLWGMFSLLCWAVDSTTTQETLPSKLAFQPSQGYQELSSWSSQISWGCAYGHHHWTKWVRQKEFWDCRPKYTTRKIMHHSVFRGIWFLLHVSHVLKMYKMVHSFVISGNSLRGVQFCEELVKVFSFNRLSRGQLSQWIFQSGQWTAFNTKVDPTQNKYEMASQLLLHLLMAASAGDETALRW